MCFEGALTGFTVGLLYDVGEGNESGLPSELPCGRPGCHSPGPQLGAGRKFRRWAPVGGLVSGVCP